MIKEHASGKDNTILIDLYTNFSSDFVESSDLYAADQFHPSDKGYQMWAKYISQNIHR
jgi:lysophospholipase L1-like esterase